MKSRIVQNLLVGSLPWHSAPRRWGHKLHSQCSYMAMFPPALPHFLIRWLTKPGEVVYDPFSGRGTTLLEARLLGRVPVGADANPLAWLLSSAKVDQITEEVIHERLLGLRRLRPAGSIRKTPRHVRRLFAEPVLAQLTSIRRSLSDEDPIDRFLLATLCGILHANARLDGTPRGLTVPMPNTFAMAPAYVAGYIRKHGLKPPIVDVVEALTRRVAELGISSLPSCRGTTWVGDARSAISWPKGMSKASLVVTSPPYLRVMKYGKLNWIRTWLIGQDPRAVDDRLFASTSLRRYLDFMTDVLIALGHRIRPEGYLCIVVGDVRRGEGNLNLATAIAEECLERTQLTLKAMITDDLPVQHKVSRIWGAKRGLATKTDRILVLGGPRAPDLPPSPKIDWIASLPRESVA